MVEKKKNFQVKCPQCKEKFMYYDSKFRPFCSERCKMVDLGHWINETYTIPTHEVPDESEYLPDEDEDENDDYRN